MALVTCPKCKHTLRKGSWEVFTHCPECNAEWSVDPDEPRRVRFRIMIQAIACAVLSFVPIVGIAAGLVGSFWGVLVARKWNVLLGTIVLLVSMVVGVFGQSAFAWWGWGEYVDHACQTKLQVLADSIYAYRSFTGKYPPSLEAMRQHRLQLPDECLVGGPYFYMPPQETAAVTTQPLAASRTATGPSSTTSATAGGFIIISTQATTKAYESTNWQDVYRASTASSPSTSPTTAKGIPTNQPASTVSVPSQESFGDSKTLIAAEVFASHRWHRMCITSDLVVRAIQHAQFDAMLKEPQNAAFAAGLTKFWAATTQPGKKEETPASGAASKPASKPATGPATSQSATSQTATKSASAPTSRPSTNQAAPAGV